MNSYIILEEVTYCRDYIGIIFPLSLLTSSKLKQDRVWADIGANVHFRGGKGKETLG